MTILSLQAFLAMNTWMNFAFYENVTIIKPHRHHTSTHVKEMPPGLFSLGNAYNCGSPSFRGGRMIKTMELVDYKSYVCDKSASSSDTQGVLETRVDKPGTYSYALAFGINGGIPEMENMTASEWEKQLDEMSRNDSFS